MRKIYIKDIFTLPRLQKLFFLLPAITTPCPTAFINPPTPNIDTQLCKPSSGVSSPGIMYPGMVPTRPLGSRTGGRSPASPAKQHTHATSHGPGRLSFSTQERVYDNNLDLLSLHNGLDFQYHEFNSLQLVHLRNLIT